MEIKTERANPASLVLAPQRAAGEPYTRGGQVVSTEQFKAQIVQMLDRADERKLSIIYHFILHITGGGSAIA